MEEKIRLIVSSAVSAWAAGFEQRHIDEYDNPDGVINSKVHNIFVAALGDEIRFFSALSRSLDSSLGNLIESIAISIAKVNFEVSQQVEGVLYAEQTAKIGALLERYKNSADSHKPAIEHYQDFPMKGEGQKHSKRHDSDYILKHKTRGDYSLIELKLGGDLDNKKARSEKEALLEQYCILANQLGSDENIRIYFATGYNRYGEGNPWKQGRVLQFFAKDELLISSDFWNFVADSPKGYEIVLDEYRKNAHLISDSINRVKKTYL
ncbi:TdeIII family type II restriction endonuclease [Rhodoluna sp. KAS3]|uniref:TdeIII family type II restriction endonuclease n=1 Tax=Rhodoluna sp. KAS3 TaxID=942880 RepID=UPI00222FA3FC|nr:TdeIII family type II restriction endonuclease [Rhodoluna sp. KAS3]